MISLPYKILAGVFIIFAATTGAYFKGSFDSKQKVEAKYEAIKAKDAALIAQLQQNITNTQNTIVTEYVDKWRTVKEREYVYVDRAQNNVPSQYYLSNGWINLHDKAARGEDINSNEASDSTPSDVKDNQALSVIATNYSRCIQNANQLTALQLAIRDAQKQVEQINRTNGNNK